MQRRSDKHGPRLAEAIEKQDTVNRTQEFRQLDGPADDEHMPDAGQADHIPPNGDSMTPAEVDERSDLAKHLDPGVFPARRDALVLSAEKNNAPDDLVIDLRTLPEDETFDNVESVWEALGGRGEHRA